MARMPDAFFVDLVTQGQPACCKALRETGWEFIYDADTRFISATHPLGGKQSVVEVICIGRSGFDADEIGKQIAMLLNGGNHTLSK